MMKWKAKNDVCKREMREITYRRPEGTPRGRWEDKFIKHLTEIKYRGADW